MALGIGIGYVMKSMGVLMLVLFLANVLLKKLNSTMTQNHRLIQMIEKVPVGKSSSLAVTKVGEKYYLMSLTEGENKILKELSAEEVESVQMNQELKHDSITPHPLITSFSSLLTDARETMKKRMETTHEREKKQ